MGTEEEMVDSKRDTRAGHNQPYREQLLRQALDVSFEGHLNSEQKSFTGFTDFRPVKITSRSPAHSHAKLDGDSGRNQE